VRILSLLVIALLLHPAATRAQTVWDMPTEYPENTMPALGIAGFAKHVAELTSGKLTIKPSFDAKAGIKSSAMLTAIAQGKVAAGDAFAGALEAEDPIFALPSLPFLVTSIADARRLADIARPHLADALEMKGMRLLYLTPWPPTGLWSRTPLKSAAELSALSIRTYDKTSSDVFASVGAKAAFISFSETMPKLVDGSINAVLSSGDGGAGRKLWEYLPNFTEITYSLPLSVDAVSKAAYDALPADQRAAVDAAGRQTEAELWATLSTRLQENHARMRQNGVTIVSTPSLAIIEALRTAAMTAQNAWCSKAGAVCAQILDAYKAAKP
jgi:TRAP-type C4-dicarboxylate transport system substrate-binding protein